MISYASYSEEELGRYAATVVHVSRENTVVAIDDQLGTLLS